jgi:hypothetical protein
MPSSASVNSNTSHEADKIYRALFGKAAPEIVRARFGEATRLFNHSPEDLQRYERVIEGGGNLEALEVACRYTGRYPILSERFRLMVYLAETLPENQPHYINDRDGLLRGLWTMIFGGVRTAWLLLRGFWILMRFPNA